MSLRKFAGMAVLSAAAAFGSGIAMAQDASIDQVYQAVRAGHYADAQGMMDKVLRDHPNSAKAHYVEAELMAREGNLSGAQGELAHADQLDPAHGYAKPESIAELRSQIAAGNRAAPARPVQNNFAPPPPQAQFAPQQRSSGLPWGLIIVFVALIVFVVMIARAFGRRNTVVQQGAPYGGGFGGGAGYGPQGMPMGGGYGPGFGGGGIGSGIVGGLATGAALGAGMVAGEELVHHFTDGNRGPNYMPDQGGGGGGGWDAPPANSDMGGSDFGTSDSGSWDSGGSSDSGGGGDWN